MHVKLLALVLAASSTAAFGATVRPYAESTYGNAGPDVVREVESFEGFAGQAMSPLPASVPSGTGSPTGVIPCTASLVTTTTAAIYIQRDASPGQALWICTLGSDGVTYAWVQRPSAIATATTTTFAAQAFLLGGCTSTLTVAISGAVVGTNTATASPIFATAPAATNPGLLNLSAWVSASGIISVQGCAFGTLTTMPAFQAKVLMY